MTKFIQFAYCLLLASSIAAANDFEGIVRLAVTSPKHDQPTYIDYALKDGFLRMEVYPADAEPPAINKDGYRLGNGSVASSIWDLKKHEAYVLMRAQKTYTVLPMADPNGLAQDAKSNVQIEKTDAKTNILGYSATKYLVKDATRKTTSEVWAAEGFGVFVTGSTIFKKNGVMSAFEKEFAVRNVFPLRMVTRDSAGKETYREEAVSIDKQLLPEDAFTLPSDYHPFDIGNTLGAFDKPSKN